MECLSGFYSGVDPGNPEVDARITKDLKNPGSGKAEKLIKSLSSLSLSTFNLNLREKPFDQSWFSK
jgi:hypothetical protein